MLHTISADYIHNHARNNLYKQPLQDFQLVLELVFDRHIEQTINYNVKLWSVIEGETSIRMKQQSIYYIITPMIIPL